MSEETTQIENVISLVEEAQKRGKFNLADAIKGRAFPEKSVDVYIDANSAMKLEEISEELKTLSQIDIEKIEKLEKEAADLVAAIQASKLTFHMRGVGQNAVEDAVKQADQKYPPNEDGTENADWTKQYICYLVSKNIYKVTDSEGNEDTSEFTVDDILELRGIMPIDSWAVLVETMQQLTLASSYFSAVTDAGFLPKS